MPITDELEQLLGVDRNAAHVGFNRRCVNGRLRLSTAAMQSHGIFTALMGSASELIAVLAEKSVDEQAVIEQQLDMLRIAANARLAQLKATPPVARRRFDA